MDSSRDLPMGTKNDRKTNQIIITSSFHDLICFSKTLPFLHKSLHKFTIQPQPKHAYSLTTLVSRMKECIGCTVCLDTSTRTMHRRQAQATADDEGMSSRASVKCRKGIAYCLHSWRSKGSALAYVEVDKPFFLLTHVLLYRLPYFVLVVNTALSQRIHCSIGDVLAVVETKGPEMEAVVCQSNDTVICYKNTPTQIHSS